MVNRNLLRQYDLSDEDLEQQLAESMGIDTYDPNHPMVTRKIKGGLLVNIGVNVFLPASQVDIRRPPDIGDYIGKNIECKILKIDEQRRNIVVSRRKLIEDNRTIKKEKLLSEIEVGQI